MRKTFENNEKQKKIDQNSITTEKNDKHLNFFKKCPKLPTTWKINMVLSDTIISPRK